jgi:Ca2+-binding EF-hand superfamily protein
MASILICILFFDVSTTFFNSFWIYFPHRFIDAVELRTVLDTELGIDLTHKEATTLITRFDLDNTGTISVDEFARFLRVTLKEETHAIYLHLFFFW